MKITINNEEVLCNKDFTINEEMLNTSSVILNNVYPVEWEQDKDYVSRFYYPKDYSKCKIFDEIEHPATREDIEGTNFSINVDATKQYQVQTLKGQTSQNGTPTPSSPVAVETTTGRQVVSVCGKNILKLIRDNETGGSYDGETDTYSSTTRLGTAVWYFKTLATSLSYTFSTQSTTNAEYLYCFSNSDLSAGSDIVSLTYGSGGNITNGNRTVYNNSNLKYLYVTFRTIGSSVEGKLEKPMLESGTTATTYEEYKGNDYEINLGKNLFYINDCSLSQNGGTVSVSNGNTISITGTFSAGTNISFDSYVNFSSANSQLGNAMTLSVQNIVNSGTASITPNRFFIASANTFPYLQPDATTGYQTKTITEAFNRCRLYVPAGTYDTTFNIQLEKGSIATSYTPYKTPIYLGKIGTYQDYIFKNTTENPLYDSNLEEGQWYIHKEIGRYVFTGNENFGTTNDVFYLVSGLDYATSNNIPVCTCLKGVNNVTTGNTYVLSNNQLAFRNSKDYDRLYLRADGYTTTTIKSALSGALLYYGLATPTNTLIEDEELINQLNSIELLEGLNNVSVSSANLPFIMSLMYNYEEGYTEEELYFCGVVENTGNISLNPRHPHYCNLQVLDFKTFLSEGETLDIVIYEKTILEAIEQIIGVIAPYGFVKGNINIYHADEMIGAYSTKDKTAYDVFNYIADITQSRWTTRMVDENTIAIDFYDPNLMPQGTAIQYNNTWFTNNKIIDMNFNYSSRDYRNKQVMLSGEVYSNVETTEIMVADGYQTQFNTTGKIGYVSNVLLNGTPASIITKEEYDLGYDGDFIYQPGNTYFESENLIPNGAIITIVYYAIIEGREVLLNQDEIEKINTMTNRKGVVARYETRNDATTTKELNQIGQSYLKYKGMPEITLKVESLENIWNIGERVEFNSPLEELSTEYMVKKKSINYITTQDNLFYTFELSSNFNSETEINYFDNQRAKTIGNIGSGEFISRNIDIENTANVIFYGLEVNEVQISGESTLQSELQTPLGVE